ncbi:MAG: glycosyltransferase [Solirubrobacteraceae bacterium]
MRILWLPHHDWEFIRHGQREQRLASLISDVHDVHFMTWHDVRTRPLTALSSLRSTSWREDGFTIHQTRRVPNVLGQRLHEVSARGLRINEQLHMRAVHQVVRREGIDVVISGIGHQSVGLPPADLPVPLIFDYLDYKLERWPEIEAAYMDRADYVMCTSEVLAARARRHHPHVVHLPNGVDLLAAGHADGGRVRRRLGLERARIVSLIGVTASERLFYVDALALAAREVPELTFLLVGDGGELGDAMVRRARELGVRVVAPGRVPHGEVADWFAATDVGLYPGDQNAYFDAASPLKVLEYSAAHRPVVATDLAELRNWSFPNVHLATPSPEGFAAAIVDALNREHAYPDLSGFSWSVLSRRLLEVIDAARDVHRQPRLATAS